MSRNTNHINFLIEVPQTPLETLVFDGITESDIKEAVLKGIEMEDAEIDKIINNKEVPSFENTMLVLEQTGDVLNRALTVMGILISNATTDKLENLAQELSPKVSEHYNNINFNTALFKRIKELKESKPQLAADAQRLLDKTYESFLRRGINLPKEKQQRLRDISIELSKSTLQFSKNVLDDTNRFFLVIKNKKELAGLTPTQLESAAQTAKEKKIDGWAFTLQGPSFRPLLTYCKNRNLRKKVWLAYNRLGCNNNQYDNKDLVKTIVDYRREEAQILGYDCYADLVLTRRMAASKENVANFLQELICKYKPQAQREYHELKEFARSQESKTFKMKPWDTGYYSHLLEIKKYKIDSEKLRPYFELSKVIDGVFGLANKLYGITFKENTGISTWDKDVKVYEVYDKDQKFLALLYADFHPRNNKKSGAWTFGVKGQYNKTDGTNVRPHVGITMNFSKPTSKKPALLTLGEVTTFLHEFGHSLHEIFSNVRFESQSGTNVYWDFVELPSQFMENYALEKEFLQTFAFHYKTGKPMPSELIDKIIESKNFQAAMACMRQISFGLLDMAYYTLSKPLPKDIINFEKKAWKEARLGAQSLKVCMTTQFQHIMTGGYSAGYYSYKWAEVLDADAFAYFKETGIFNTKTAESFRRNILEKGSTEDPNILYKNFRTKAPSIDALLERDGIINPK